MDPRDVLSRIGFGYAILGEEPMRARAFTNAARIVRKFGTGLPEAYVNGDLAKVRGVGRSVLAVVGAALADEPVPQLVALQAQIPESVFEMRSMSGVGPSKIKTLWLDLGLTSIAEIEYACTENRLTDLPGFGAKTQAKVLASVIALRSRSGRARMDKAQALAAGAVAILEAMPTVERVAIAGQVRRGVELTDRIDLVVQGALTEDPEPDVGGLPLELHFCDDAAGWGAALVRATGSPEHVAALEARGSLTGPDEETVYRNLGLLPTAPERRSADVPLTKLGTRAPELVRRSDLRGALHNHTTSSDGIHSLEDMRAAATRMGLEYLGISEHSETAAYAGGLTPQRLLAQVEDVAALNALGDGGAVLLSGIESDILRDGSLDYDPYVLAELDLIVASVHGRGGLDRTAMTARMVRAASNPWTDVIGHPTGRLLLGRPASEYDVEAFLDACSIAGCAVELNANPQRLDLNERHCAMARERGIPVSISADAHSTAALNHLDFGIVIARRAGLRARDILNCMTLTELEAWLSARKARALAVGSAI